MDSTTRSIEHRDLTIDQIRLSPFNARQSVPTIDDTASLEDAILKDGLRVPIEVHLLRGQRKIFGAFAGRRRYFAMRRLIERGDLPTDFRLKAEIYTGYSDAELVERSLKENLERLEMTDAELWLGVAKAAALGHTPAQIAAALAQTDQRRVERWVRLGRLAKPVLDAFVAGELQEDQIKAYAATPDRDLQASVFARMSRKASPQDIRAAMKIGDATARRQLMFVGEAIYRAAGGRYTLDLFADDAEERGRVVDEGKLQQLVEEKMETVRDRVRATTSLPDLRFVATPPQTPAKITDNHLAINPNPDGKGLRLPKGDIVAHVEIDVMGEPLVTYWWASRSAKAKGDRTEMPGASYATGKAAAEVPIAKVEATVRKEEGLSSNAIYALQAVRKAILRAALCDDADTGGTIGTDLLVFVQARALLDASRPFGLGMRVIAHDHQSVSADAMAIARDLIAQTPGARITGQSLQWLHARPFFTERDLAKAFDLYVGETLDAKHRTAALVAGVALERSLAVDGLACPLHDAAAHHMQLDRDDQVRAYWTPTADMLELFPKPQRRELAEGLVDRATYENWTKLNGGPLTSAVLTAVTRAGGKGETWVPPLLRFTGTVSAQRVAIDEVPQ